MPETNTLQEAAQAVLDRWDSPEWEWTKQSPTADLMHGLRTAIAAQAARPNIPPGWESSYAIGDLLLAVTNWKASTTRNARPAFDDLVKACAALVAAAQPAR